LATKSTKQLGHDGDIQNVRHAADNGLACSQQSHGHQLQTAVFGSRDLDVAYKARTTVDSKDFHKT
jgi:hypothetical protein